jgi:predicted O-methyltransferase YrrM
MRRSRAPRRDTSTVDSGRSNGRALGTLVPMSRSIRRRLADVVIAAAASHPVLRREVAARIFAVDPQAILDGIGPKLSHNRQLDELPLDLDPDGSLEFVDLAGLLASTHFDHGIAGLSVRELAYLHGLTRRIGARTAIEIGRFRGGSSIAISSALPPDGTLFSIDVGAKEARLGTARRPYDDQIRDFAGRFHLPVELIVGNSHTVEVETGTVDLAFIDGDHSYAAAAEDLRRWGSRVRPGGAVLLHDAYADAFFPPFDDDVRRVVDEAVESGAYRLVKRIDTIAHLEPTGAR